MYCTRCGAQMPEGTNFCTACGAPMVGATDPAAPAAPSAPAKAPAADSPAPSRPSRMPLVVAGIAVAAIVFIGIAAVATSGFGLLGQKGADTAPVAAEAEDDDRGEGSDDADDPAPIADEQDETTTEAPAAAPDAEGTQDAPREPSAIAVDLGNQGDREVVNCFITNFSEVNEGLSAQSSYSREDPLDRDTIVEMLVFVERHMNGNANPYLEEVGSSDPMAAAGYQFRCEASYMCELVYKYFGVGIDIGDLPYERSAGGRGVVSGSWFYYAYGSDAWFASQGVANVTSLTDLGGNLYDVSFDVYRPAGNLAPADILLRVYGWPLSEMLEAVGAGSSPIYSGTATIEAYLDEGELAFRLYRMN